jgi:hypothetical protein
MEEVFEERSRVDAITHGKHHEWIEIQIALDKERLAIIKENGRAKRAVYWSVAKVVAQYSVLGLLGALVYYFQHGHWPG